MLGSISTPNAKKQLIFVIPAEEKALELHLL
jgi:hypothetical protein